MAPPAPGASSAPDDRLIGSLVSERYRVLRKIAEGGFGAVYEAEHELIKRRCALKRLHPHLTSRADVVERFRREALAASAIQHRHIVEVTDMGRLPDGSVFIALEYLDGRDLARVIKDVGALPLRRALHVAKQLCDALGAAHAAGIVHCDLKPENIVLVSRDGDADFVKVVDFGISKVRDADGESPTATGAVLGTPQFMAPEQVNDRKTVDHRADLYAIGVVLFIALTGRPPFQSATPLGVIFQVCTVPAPPLSDLLTDAPPALTALVASLLEKDPANRPQDCAALRALLEAIEGGTAPRAAPAGSASIEATCEAVVVPTSPHVMHSLPAERDPFVGREADLTELAARIARARLVTVLGIGGTGKTRLVTRHGWSSLAEWPGGVWFCDLVEARDIAGITHAVARTLDVPLGKGDPVVQLGHAVAGRGRCLLILDNFEQVTALAPATLGAWLDRAAEARFVVTSRELLGLPGEDALALAPLTHEEAIDLFVRRAEAARRDFRPTADDVSAIDALVDLLDRLPLAIELAAARVRLMSPRTLLARMGRRFELLASAGGRSDRQATLRAMLDWSWDLLSPAEQGGLAQVSVFEGGFTLDAAEAVLDAPGQWPGDVLQGLVDKSLVRPITDDRFDLLVSVREYAAERLDALGERDAAEIRHGAYYATFGAPEALDALGSHGGVDRLRALGREHDNLTAACRRALGRGDGATATATLAAAWEVLKLRGPMRTAIDLSRRALALSMTGTPDRLRALDVLGGSLWTAGQTAEAFAQHDAMLALARDAGERRWEGEALDHLAVNHGDRGLMEQACRHGESAVAIARELGDRRSEGVFLGHLGMLRVGMGRMEEGAALVTAAVALVRAVGDRRHEGILLGALGTLRTAQGRMDDALVAYDAALAIVVEAGDRRHEGIVLASRSTPHMLQGRAAAALRDLAAALVIARTVGDRRAESTVLFYMGNTHLAMGRLEEARRCYDASLPIAREVGERGDLAYVLHLFGNLHAAERRGAEARARYGEALAIAREVSARRYEGLILVRVGVLERAEGRDEAGRQSFEAALAIARAVGDARSEGICLGHLGLLDAKAGRFTEARDALARGEALVRTVGDRFQLAVLLCNRSEAESLGGDGAAARAPLEEADGILRALGAGPDSEIGRAVARACAASGLREI